MKFDLFHSISDPIIEGRAHGHSKSVQHFVEQVKLAEQLQFDTVWLAESHFSSEVQKETSVATIPNFFGEVGLNADSFSFIQFLINQTKRINFGTGIHNIVGGSGGPIASADRVNFLRFLNQNYWGRQLRIGVAAGRFPYQNTPFGIIPRDGIERDFWPQIKRTVFLEALEIFLRLLNGETLASSEVTNYEIKESDLKPLAEKATALKERYQLPLPIQPRWEFEKLRLVPDSEPQNGLHIVLGSSDPLALDLAVKYWDIDLFNLSFTPPERLNALHDTMVDKCRENGREWNRSRLPRTVMVFIDRDRKKAHELAHFVLDTYIEAMRGTAQVPDKEVLLQRALVGDGAEVRDQLHPENPRRFDPDDRLMLWFEFNQSDSQGICSRMRYFAEEVAAGLFS